MPADVPASKRDELLEIASRLFYEQGFGATGIQQIIKEAGAAKGTFYAHFASKEELGVAWLQQRDVASGKWLERFLDRHKTPGKKLLATFDFLLDWQKADGYRGCAFINTASETPDFSSPMRKVVSKHKKAVRKLFETLAWEHFEERGFTKKEAKEKALTIYLLFEGALTETEIEGAAWPSRAAKAGAASILEAEKE